MEAFLVDARQALRALRRERGLVLLAVLAMAMGIGFPTTMFSIVHGATRSLPFENPDDLVVVTRTHPARGIDDLGALPWDVAEWRRGQTTFDGLEAFRRESANLAGPGLRPERITSTAITPRSFDVLGVTPVLGRGLRADDARPGAAAVVLLGDRLWRTRYAEDAGIVGDEIRIDGQPHTVVGVMPPDFGFPVNSQAWRPLALDASTDPAAGEPVTVFGRLRNGATLDQARIEMAAIAQRLERADPASHEGLGARVLPFVDLEMDPAMVPVLYLMAAAVSLVLLIACANVANMLLARASARQRDVALRTALGASRRRIVAQHLVETAAVAMAGGTLGVLAASFAVRWFDRMSAGVLEAFWVDFRVDGPVLAFSASLVVIAALAAGLGPALQASRANLAGLLKDAAGGMSSLRLGRLGRGLVVVELALACALLAVAGAIVRGAIALRSVDMPFDATTILTGQIAFTESVAGEADRRDAYVRDIAARLDGATGVGAAALISTLPGRGGNWSFTLDDPATESVTRMPTTAVAFVTPGFLDVLGADVLRGRDIGWGDARGAGLVALVNESFIARHSPDRDPVGRVVRLGGSGEPRTIVGVVPDLLAGDIDSSAQDGVYLPMLQTSPFAVRAMLRTTGPALSAVPLLRDAVEAVDADLPVFEIASLRDAIYADKVVLDAFATLFFLFGAGALLLTTTGLYGVVAFGVNQRTREMGIRMALGAARRDILLLVLRQGGRHTAVGFVIGIALALALTRGLASAIEFVRPFDPLVLGAVTGILLSTAALATLVPARRAAATSPLQALRRE